MLSFKEGRVGAHPRYLRGRLAKLLEFRAQVTLDQSPAALVVSRVVFSTLASRMKPCFTISSAIPAIFGVFEGMVNNSSEIGREKRGGEGGREGLCKEKTRSSHCATSPHLNAPASQK